MFGKEQIQRLILIAGYQKMRLTFLAATIVLTSAMYLCAKTDDAVPYPEGYRHWTHVKSTIIGPTSPLYPQIGGIQHIYANEKGMEGYRNGRFPEGSILIYDFLKTEEDAKNTGRIIEASRRFTSVMVKDSKRYAATGGWGFEEFRGDSQTDRMIAQDAPAKCYNCHTQRKDNDFVFSVYRK